MGSTLWLQCVGGTYPFDTFNGPIRLDERQIVATCEWRWAMGMAVNNGEMGFIASFAWEPGAGGIGIPLFSDFSLNIHSIYDGLNYFVGCGQVEEFEEQIDCKWLPDPVPTLSATAIDPRFVQPIVLPTEIVLRWGWPGKSPF